MNLTRIIFVAVAVLLPASWTTARANDEAPAGDDKTERTTKKSKKSKKADGTEETHTETKTEKKAD
jgi:hypothetical protein